MDRDARFLGQRAVTSEVRQRANHLGRIVECQAWRILPGASCGFHRRMLPVFHLDPIRVWEFPIFEGQSRRLLESPIWRILAVLSKVRRRAWTPSGRHGLRRAPLALPARLHVRGPCSPRAIENEPLARIEGPA